MSSPTPSTADLRGDLAIAIVDYELDATANGIIAMDLFPVTDVPVQSANMGRIPIEQLLQEQDDTRAAGGGYNRGQYKFGKFVYATEEHGWEEPVDDRLKNQYARYFDAEVIATKRARAVVLQNHANRVYGKVLDTTVIGNAAAAAVWSNWSSATPIADVQAAILAQRNACGILPNTLALDFEAYVNLTNCHEVVDRLKYGGFDDPKKIGTAALATLFKIQNVVVAGGVKNTANQAKAASLATRWDKTKALVATVADDSDLQKVCLGRTLHWDKDGSSIGGTVESYRDESKRCDVIRVRMDTDEPVIYPQAARIITGVL